MLNFKLFRISDFEIVCDLEFGAWNLIRMSTHDNRNGDLYHIENHHDGVDYCGANAYSGPGHWSDNLSPSSGHSDQRDDIDIYTQDLNDHCGIADLSALDDHHSDRFREFFDDFDANPDQIAEGNAEF